MAWRHNEPVPQELIDVLLDDEETGDDKDGLVEEEEVGDQIDIEHMPVFIAHENGTLHQIHSPGGAGDQPGLDSDSEDDDGWEIFHQQMKADISPVSSPGVTGSPADSARSPARFRIEVLEEPEPETSAARGRESVRGRGRGGGRRRGRSRRPIGMMKDGRWMRGQPIRPVYVDDADLPPDLREKIQHHLVQRERRVFVDVKDERSEQEGDEFPMNEEFEWRGIDAWNGVKENFVPESTGPTQNFTNAYDAMHAIWTDEIIGHIATESNRYAQSTLSQRARFARDWFETNIHEVWCLFAFWIMLGIIRMPSIKSCFTKVSLLKTDVYRLLFTETRYWNLNAAFNLVEDANPDNPLNPMGPILDHLNLKFKELYRLDQEICIDESLTLWKGPGGFKQYIKTKSARFGIKTYQLCESATGYLWSFFVYVGRATGSESMPSSVSTVLRLIRPLLNLGHTLFMDNWFNSPTLARWLKRQRTDCVGTLRANRKHVPVAIKYCPLQEGQYIARASDGVMVVAIQDRKRVTCMSTYHDVSQIYKEPRPGHPAQYRLGLIDDYNKAMGGVDRLDQMLEAYLVERKQCQKWNKKLFKRLLNISIQNSRILVEKSTGAKVDALAFRLALVQEIINRHLPNVPRKPNPKSTRNPCFPMQRLTERHFIRRIPITEEMRQSVVHRCNLGRRICVWCTHNGINRSRTVYECAECQLPLCLEPCFKNFHITP